MFRMNKSSQEILDEGNLNKYQLAAHKRQLVYKAILDNPYIMENKQLAEAAGYDMSDWTADSYTKGSAFIQNMLRQGYIEKHLGKDGQEYFYITSKEKVDAESPTKTIKNEDDYAKARLEEEREAEMGPEGQPKQDWVNDEPESLKEARASFTKLMEECEETIYDEPCEDEEYSGCLSIGQSGSKGNIQIRFSDKTKAEIIEIINNLNLEDIF